MMKSIKAIAIVASLLGAQVIHAKGLDELNPSTDTKEAAPETKVEEKAPAEAPAVKTEPEKPEPEVKKAEVTAETVEPKPIEPSATSRKLADKLSLSTGLFFNRLKGTKGSWAAGGGRSEIGAQYLVAKDPFKSGMLKHVDILASMRYAPIDVTLKSNRQSYKGVVEGFHFGAQMSRIFNEHFRSIGGLELSYYSVHLVSTDGFPETASAAKNGVGATINAGCDWIFANKMTIGPRADISFGSYNGFSLGGSAGVVF